MFIQARARRFSQNFLFCFCISNCVANVCFCKPPRRERGQGREPDRCHPDANEGFEMPAGGSMFDILHHSQLVFSAEMSDQLTALPLTFNRKTAQQMQVGLTGPGPTGGLWQLLDPCFYRSAVFIWSAPQKASLSSHRSTQNESFISSHFQIRLTFPDAPKPLSFPAFPPSYTDIRWAHLKRRSRPPSVFFRRCCGCERIRACIRREVGCEKRVFCRSPRVGWTWMSLRARKHSVTTTHVFTVVIIKSWRTEWTNIS